jgi:hypothetical protein
VETHGPKVVSTHATEFKAISFVLGHLHILKAFGRFPNTSEKGALFDVLILRRFALRGYGVRVDILRQCAQETNVHESERDHGILALPRESSRFPGEGENLRCIQLDLSPFCKIDGSSFRFAIADDSTGNAFC